VAPPEPRPLAAPLGEPSPPRLASETPAAVLEAAELDPRPERTQFRLVLRDDHLGRVSLSLTERAGLIDLMVRADRRATVRTLQDSLPVLVDQLTQRQFRADTAAYAPQGHTGEQRDPSQERERRQRQGQPQQRSRLRARRVAGPFQLAAQ
jgi:hypothetical protein